MLIKQNEHQTADGKRGIASHLVSAIRHIPQTNAMAVEGTDDRLAVHPSAIGEIGSAMRANGIDRSNAILFADENQGKFADRDRRENLAKLTFKRNLMPAVI